MLTKRAAFPHPTNKKSWVAGAAALGLNLLLAGLIVALRAQAAQQFGTTASRCRGTHWAWSTEMPSWKPARWYSGNRADQPRP